MEFQLNKINQVIFDVHYPEQESAGSMQNKIISDFNNYMQKILDEKLKVFTRLSIIRANKIELNLGVLTKQDVENNLPEIFSKKLDDFLKSLKIKIETRNLPSGIEEVSLEDYIYEFLYAYFKDGVLPWNLQELGESNRLEYWLHFLYNLNSERSKQLGTIFIDNDARKRLTLILKRNRYDYILPMLFKDEIFADRKVVENIINMISRSISDSNADFAGIIQKEFFIWLSGTRQKSGTRKLEASQLAKEFYIFLYQIQGTDAFLTISTVVAYQLEKSKNNFEEQFFNELKGNYFNEIVNRYAISYLKDSRLGGGSLNEKYFDKYLQLNYPEYRKQIVSLTNRIVSKLALVFTDEKDGKIDGVARTIVLESLSNISLPNDFGEWFKKILDEVLLIFGSSSHKQIKEFLIQEQKQLVAELKYEEIIDQIELPSLTIQDGSVKYNIKLQQAITYFELFQTYGISALESIFYEPVNALLNLISWLEDKHFGTYRKIVKLFQEQSDPLWRQYVLNNTPEEFARHFVSEKFTELDFEEALIIEVFEKGYLPSHEIHRIGVGKIRTALKNFIYSNNDKVILLSDKYYKKLGSIYAYLKGVLDPDSLNQFKQLITAKHKVESVKSSDEVYDLSRFQLLLPYLLDNNLSIEQKQLAKIYIQKQIEMRNSEFAVFLLSLKQSELHSITNILSGAYSGKIKQLTNAYRQKYKPEKENEKQPENTFENKKEFKPFREGEVLYIRNAGLVLVNPYFTMLFNRLGITEDKKFIDEKAQTKAMQLLQYIATSNDQPEEHDLILNKVLVGIDPFESIPELHKLTNEEKELCDGLIDAVIKNWSVLKNTSPDNLRASFFIRNGKLLFGESNWRLSVEQKSIDVLLDKMPWSFSMIKLPWMEHPLVTDWR